MDSLRELVQDDWRGQMPSDFEFDADGYWRSVRNWRAHLAPYWSSTLNITNICSRCDTLDLGGMLDEMFNKKINEETRRWSDDPTWEFNIDTSLLEPGCIFCTLFMSARSGYEGFKWLHPSTESTALLFFNVISTDSISRSYRVTCEFIPDYNYEVDEPLVEIIWPENLGVADIQSLKSNFACCMEKHGSSCGSRARIPIKSFRLYNCRTLQIEDADPGTKYVALSYVWGNFTINGSISESTLPKTFKDARRVTLEFGYKYLWIDQLCINQRGAHKLEQIRQMDAIYQNADLTIIAAAGKDPTHGIPGIGRGRQGQRCYSFRDYICAECKMGPAYCLGETVWATRGWTFQEQKLSRRCLVFTDQEAWFTCAILSDYEGVESVPAWIRRKQQRLSETVSRREVSFPHGGKYDPHDFCCLLHQYSGRDLGDPSDVLNAFSGIMKVFERWTLPIFHLWGAAIMSPALRTRIRRLMFERPPSDGFICGLRWSHRGPLRRRAGFPSWSWSGWIGQVSYDCDWHRYHDTGPIVSVERKDQVVLSWSDFEEQSYLKEQPDMISRFIRLDAWTMDVKLFLLPDRAKEQEVMAQFDLKDGTQVSSKASLCTCSGWDPDDKIFEPFRDKTFTGILLCSVEHPRNSYVLLVKTGPTYAERIGHIELKYRYSLMVRDPRCMERWVEMPELDDTSWFDLRLLRLVRKEIRLG